MPTRNKVQVVHVLEEEGGEIMLFLGVTVCEADTLKLQTQCFVDMMLTSCHKHVHCRYS